MSVSPADHPATYTWTKGEMTIWNKDKVVWRLDASPTEVWFYRDFITPEIVQWVGQAGHLGFGAPSREKIIAKCINHYEHAINPDMEYYPPVLDPMPGGHYTKLPTPLLREWDEYGWKCANEYRCAWFNNSGAEANLYDYSSTVSTHRWKYKVRLGYNTPLPPWDHGKTDRYERVVRRRMFDVDRVVANSPESMTGGLVYQNLPTLRGIPDKIEYQDAFTDKMTTTWNGSNV